MFLMTSVMSNSSQIQPYQRKSFGVIVLMDRLFLIDSTYCWRLFCDLKSLFCSHRLHSLHGGGFPLCIVVWRCLGGGAGEEDEVIFGLKDLREMRLVKPPLKASNRKCQVAAWHVTVQCW